MHSEEENINDKVNDPLAHYKKSEIHFFHSLEEQENYNLKQIASQNPVDRIKETVDLILRVYGFTREDLRNRPLSNEIHIDLQ